MDSMDLMGKAPIALNGLRTRLKVLDDAGHRVLLSQIADLADHFRDQHRIDEIYCVSVHKDALLMIAFGAEGSWRVYPVSYEDFAEAVDSASVKEILPWWNFDARDLSAVLRARTDEHPVFVALKEAAEALLSSTPRARAAVAKDKRIRSKAEINAIRGFYARKRAHSLPSLAA